MSDDSNSSQSNNASIGMRVWATLPDWLFQLMGVSFCVAIVGSRIPNYFDHFWEMGIRHEFADGNVVRLPWTQVLVDLTFFIMAVSFCFRLPPKSRVTKGSDVIIGLMGGFWPLLPLAILAILDWSSPENYALLSRFMWADDPQFIAKVIGASLILVGNGLDVWGYSVLLRSFSIVPEARQLKVNGPYRLVRHPVYLGQVLAQAGVWICFANTHFIWLGFFMIFVLFQLWRSKLEDRVLEAAFGESYLEWKQKTFWFV